MVAFPCVPSFQFVCVSWLGRLPGFMEQSDGQAGELSPRWTWVLVLAVPPPPCLILSDFTFLDLSFSLIKRG